MDEIEPKGKYNRRVPNNNKFIDRGDYYEVELVSKTHGLKYAKIDKEDYDKCYPKRWGFSYSKETESGYALHHFIVGKNGKNHAIGMHRLVMDARKGFVVDHINHDTLDNRKANLRIISHRDNMLNRKGCTKANKLGVRNVYKTVSKSGNIYYNVEIRKKYFGTYKSLDEAKKVAERERSKAMASIPDCGNIR